MKPEQILSHSGHRPFELPRGQWLFYQEWHDVIFLHWPVVLTLPPGLVIKDPVKTAP
jgi:uncharacterized protein